MIKLKSMSILAFMISIMLMFAINEKINMLAAENVSGKTLTPESVSASKNIDDMIAVLVTDYIATLNNDKLKQALEGLKKNNSPASKTLQELIDLTINDEFLKISTFNIVTIPDADPLKPLAELLKLQGCIRGVAKSKLPDSDKPENINNAFKNCDKAIEIIDTLPYKEALTRFEYLRAILYLKSKDFKKSKELYKNLLEKYRNLDVKTHGEYQPVISDVLNNLGFMTYFDNDLKEAKDYYTENLSIIETLARKNPDRYKSNLANTLHRLANTDYYSGNVKEADENIKRSLKIYRDILNTNPEQLLPELLSTTNDLATYAETQKKYDLAEKCYTENLILLKKLSKIQPDKYDRSLAETLVNYASYEMKINKLKEADNFQENAVQLIKGLKDKDPALYVPLYADALNDLGVIKFKLQKFEEAKKYLLKSVELYKTLSEKEPDTYLPEAVNTLENLSLACMNLNEFTEALQFYYYKRLVLEYLIKKEPDEYLPRMAKTCNDTAVLLTEGADLFKEAYNYFLISYNIYYKLSEKDPDTYMPILAKLDNNIGCYLTGKDDPQKVEKFFNEALEIYRILIKKNREEYLLPLANTISNLGVLQIKKDDIEGADKSCSECLPMYREVAKKETQENDFSLAVALVNYSVVKNKQKKYDEAIDLLNEALKIEIKLSQNNPKRYLPELAKVYEKMANVQMNTNKKDEALQNYVKAVQIVDDTIALTPNILNVNIYKKAVGFSYLKLMDIYSNKEHKDETKVFKLLESYRDAFIKTNLNSKEIPESLKLSPNDVILNIQGLSNKTLFLISSAQGNKMTLGDMEFISRAMDLESATTKAIEKVKGGPLNYQAAHKLIVENGKKTYDLLPEEVKELFKSTDKQIYLSLDERLVNTPLEFMVDNKEEFLGKKHLLSRIQGANSINYLRQHQRNIKITDTIVLVGNPDKTLPASEEELTGIKNIFDQFGYTISDADCLTQDKASREAILNDLKEDTAIFHYSGHGRPPDKLILANNTFISGSDFFSKNFTNNPLFFINSCQSGTSEYIGGGVQLSIANIVFFRGGQAVISSYFPVYSNSAKAFSNDYYKYLLEGSTAGEAIMKARHDKKYPWEWGLFKFQGNPDVKIKRN